MDKKRIVNALVGLDVKNDEHWTSEGLPLLVAVEEAMGEPVTRAEVSQAAPEFTRTNYKFPGDEKPREPMEASANEDAWLEGEAGKSRFQGEIDVLETKIATMKTELALQSRQISQAEENLIKLVKDRDAQFPPMKPAEAIKDWIESQQRQRAVRAVGVAEASRLLEGRPMPMVGTPLDNALRNRRRPRRS